MSPYYVPDPPDIRAMERNGYIGKEPHFPHCPVCGAACEEMYYDRNGEYFGCDVCVKSRDAWDEHDCFPDDEEED